MAKGPSFDELSAEGMECVRTKQWERAVALFEQAIRLRPKSVDSYRELVAALVEIDRWDEAVERGRVLARLAPDLAEGHELLGYALLQLERYKEAIAAYRNATHLDPDNALAHLNLGLSYAGAGEHEHAADSFRDAVALDPRNGAAHGNVGAALGSLGRWEECLWWHRQAIALEDVALYHKNLGTALVELGRLEEGEKEYRETIRQSPDDIDAVLRLASVLAEMGKNVEAIALFRRVIGSEPANSDAHAHSSLGGALSMMEHHTEAISECRLAVDLESTSKTQYNLGIVLSRAGRDAEAIEPLRRARALRPEWIQARMALAESLAAVGQNGEAASEYEAALRLDERCLDDPEDRAIYERAMRDR